MTRLSGELGWRTGLLLLLVSAEALAGSAGAHTARRLGGLELGETTLHGAVRALGSPNAVYLAGMDSRGTAEPDAALLFAWERTFPLVIERQARWTIAVAPGASVVTNLSVDFPASGRPRWSELEVAFPGERRVVRRPLLMDEDELEGAVGACEDPDGEVVTIVVPAWGLDAYLETDGAGRVEVLHFSTERRREGYPPPCEDDGTARAP